MSDPVDTDALRKLLYNDVTVEVIRLRHGLRAAADEVDRLRAVVENAPHAFLECTARGLDCRCWKADAL